MRGETKGKVRSGRRRDERWPPGALPVAEKQGGKNRCTRRGSGHKQELWTRHASGSLRPTSSLSPLPSPMSADPQAILRQRATLLAREMPREEEDGALLEVVEFGLGRERYGFAAEHVREVVRLENFSPLPCTPRWVAGIMNVRGQILTVIDLRAWLDLPPSGLAEKNDVILLRGSSERPADLGVLADAILGVRTLCAGTLQSSLPTLAGPRAALLRGVTADRLTVLDAAKLLADEALLVREEVAP